MAAMTLTDFFGAVGTELCIFITTLLVALAFRRTQKVGPGKVMSPRQKIVDCTSTVSNGVRAKRSPSSSPSPQSVSPRDIDDLADSVESRTQRRAGNQGPRPDDARWMDEVCQLAWDSCDERRLHAALHRYKAVRDSPQGLCIHRTSRKCQQSPLDFYSALVQCALRVGRPQLINEFLDDMAKEGVARSLSFYERVMKRMASQKHFVQALNIYDRLRADGFEPSMVTRSCVISFASEVGDLNRAVKLFEDLAQTTTPSIRAHMTVLRVMSKQQDWPKARKLFSEMQARGVPVDCLVLNIVISVGVAADQLAGVEALLVEVQDFKPAITDVVSFNTLLKGYAQRNDDVKAQEVIVRMRAQGLRPNAISFNTAMDAAVRGSQSARAFSLLREMRNAGLRPDKFTCTILAKGVREGATTEYLNGILDLLKDAATQCDSTLQGKLYQAVLEVSAQKKDEAMLRNIFMQMKQQRVPMPAGALRLLKQSFGQDAGGPECSTSA